MQLIGKHVAAARKLLGMTQIELAAAVGVGQATIARFETGFRIRPASLAAIRKGLEDRGIEFTNGNSPGAKLRPEKAVAATRTDAPRPR